MLVENPTNLDLSAQVDRVLRRNIQFPQRTIVGTSFVTVLDYMIFFDSNAVPVLGELPDAASNPGMIFEFRSISGGNGATVRATGADTIDGVTDRRLSTIGLVLRIISDGTSTWRILLYTQLSSETGITLRGGIPQDGTSISNTVPLRDIDNGTGNEVLYSLDVPGGLDTATPITVTYYPVVITVGGGDADAEFRTDFRVFAVGDLTSKASQGFTLTSFPITAVVDRVHSVTQGFGAGTMLQGRFANFVLTRTVTDPFTGNLGVMREGSFFFLRRS